MVTVYLALGSNLGDPAHNLELARLAIAALPQTKLVAASSVHTTEPVNAEGDDFANSVVKIETELSAYALLDALQKIEMNFGRPCPDSPSRNALSQAGQGLAGGVPLKPARTLDLDILLYGDSRIDSPKLTVPHPRMRERAFVMLPLAEIAPELALT
ncbi:MAG: 2-amino-4-hydroxy-6-hydroxymethyldihydropteridine diphosphokinase [Cytophagales bacterium]|nr:2-amino-4-hydroxy-6-hydroxymethyldihydropteridine diphosphokinase [Cytophagales bacterium]